MGNTTPANFYTDSITVHPHLRGEYQLRPFAKSPHERFIPTCVGNTIAVHTVNCLITVHPHLRGEYAVPLFLLSPWRSVHPHLRGEYGESRHPCLAYRGSSPLAWGILRGTALSYSRNRFIPTCVGNTIRASFLVWMESGSSPLAWGIPSSL